MAYLWSRFPLVIRGALSSCSLKNENEDKTVRQASFDRTNLVAVHDSHCFWSDLFVESGPGTFRAQQQPAIEIQL